MRMRTIAVVGAGNIGCYVGGMLAVGGHSVRFLGRRRTIDAISERGLRLTSFDGADNHIAGERVLAHADPAVISACEIVLVAVKSADTAAAADIVAAHADANATVISLQNGVSNVSVLSECIEGRRIIGGMVPFNVMMIEPGHVHRATSGDIMIGPDDENIAQDLSSAAMPVLPVPDMIAVQYGKLLMNLNNAVNALSGLTLREQLRDRRWRRVYAACVAEALEVMRRSGIRPAKLAALPPALMPTLLRSPDFIFHPLLDRLMKIDATARSSMWDDLERRKRTEIDYLQGVIVDLAAKAGNDAPVARRIIERVKAAEQAQAGSPRLLPDALVS